MAVVWCDGFEVDFANATAGYYDWIAQYNITNEMQWGATPGKTGNYSLKFVNEGNALHWIYIAKSFPSTLQELYMGFHIYFLDVSFNPFDNDHCPLIGTLQDDDDEWGVTFCWDVANDTVGIIKGDTDTGSILWTGPSALSRETWYHFSVHIDIANVGGQIDVKKDGEAWGATFNGDTDNGGGSATGFRTGIFPYGSQTLWGDRLGFLIDDLVIQDTTGSWANGHVEERRVYAMYPGANGTYSDFAYSGGTDYQVVAELATPGNTPDGNYAYGTSGDFTVEKAAVTVPAAVDAIQIMSYDGLGTPGLFGVRHKLITTVGEANLATYYPTDFGWNYTVVDDDPTDASRMVTSTILEFGCNVP
jgi:hypothetical protein